MNTLARSGALWISVGLTALLGLSVPLDAAEASPAPSPTVEISSAPEPTESPAEESAQPVEEEPTTTPEPSVEPSTSQEPSTPDDEPATDEATVPDETADGEANESQVPEDQEAEETEETEAPREDADEGESSEVPEQFSMPGPLQDGRGCHYAEAGSDGAYAQNLCWLDFEGFTTELERRGTWSYWDILGRERRGYDYRPGLPLQPPYYGGISDYPVRIELAGDHTLTAELAVTHESGHNRAYAVETQSFPTWSGAFLGNEGFYAGVGGSPAFQQVGSGTSAASTRVSLENIQLTGPGPEHETVHDFSIVVADAESTDDRESINWSTTGKGFEWMPNTPGASDHQGTMGNACGGGFSPALGASSTSASCQGGTGSKTGTAMLQTAPEEGRQFDVTQVMNAASGRQGVAFGVLMGGVELNVEVDDRIVDTAGEATNANFQASVQREQGNLVSIETGESGDSASTGHREKPVNADGTQLEFVSSASGAHADSYIAEWVCTKDTPDSADPLQWPESGTSPTPPPADGEFSRLGPGDNIHCTVTYVPPYLSLLKTVNQNGTDADNGPANWLLTASSDDSLMSVAGDAEMSVPLAVGSYEFSETVIDEENLWEYGYDWSDLQCTAVDGSTDLEEPNTETDDDGAIVAAELSLAVGNNIACTFTNTARQPQLVASKEAFLGQSESALEHGATVEPGDTLTYTLTFANTEGSHPAEVNHVDHLRDLLDDAAELELIESSDGLDTEFTGLDGEEPTLSIIGEVPAGEAATVTYQAVVKENLEDLDDRRQAEGPVQGFTLRNYLTEEGAEVPESCEPASEEEPPLCTEQVISAWTFDKNSFPADGARMNQGGNPNYVLTATKLNEGTTIEDLVFTDDLTHAFKTAGWAPDAPVPGGAKTRGIYFIDADGNTLDAEGVENGTATDPVPAYGPDYVGEPESEDGRWILETDSVNVPASAERAELWFSLEVAQSPVGIPSTEAWQGPNAPQNGWQFVNYAMAKADSDPVQCGPDTWTQSNGAPDTSIAPTAADPVDPNVPQACRTVHELNAGFFTIRKDASGSGLNVPQHPAYGDDPTGLWNMVGHEFEMYDDVDGEPSQNPSQYLCRSDYHPDTWSGVFTSHPGDRTLDDWDSADSDTLSAIRAWNEDPSNASDSRHPLPECAILYAQPEDSGGQTGRYRGENFQPVLPEGETADPRHFWLVETRAPDAQISLNGQQRRAVEGVQLLAEPIPLTIWGYQDGEHQEGPSWHGKRQLDVRQGEGSFLDRCAPGGGVADRPTACVNPTGYLMLVQDTVPMRLPLTGGNGWAILSIGGAVLLLVALAGTFWWRRRQAQIAEEHTYSDEMTARS